MVVSGVVLPSAIWSDELTQQVTLARASVVHMALAYHNAGFVVVVDDFWDPNSGSDYLSLLSHPCLHKIVLHPAQVEAHRRNLRRSGASPARGYIDEGVRIVYRLLNAAVPQLMQDGWVVVDTTALSLEETVTAVLQLTGVEI